LSCLEGVAGKGPGWEKNAACLRAVTRRNGDPTTTPGRKRKSSTVKKKQEEGPEGSLRNRPGKPFRKGRCPVLEKRRGENDSRKKGRERKMPAGSRWKGPSATG